MPSVEIYTTGDCPFCARAKALFQGKGVAFSEYRIEGNRERMREMLKRCRQKTVPQIFIADRHLGGYEEIAELNATGELDSLLNLNGHG
ncbi:MAG: glutaredoxin 3 [Sedimenticola sp.]|jgi:glutaredoxin 3|nr:MAG: glutaredoxin 3 [Sedimenticola sp.]